ncbi:MAG: hypothetical protein LUC45_03640, partial [Paraprevotella sp.]|nr:hypothetical protein [Paraprevotella sp.]
RAPPPSAARPRRAKSGAAPPLPRRLPALRRGGVAMKLARKLAPGTEARFAVDFFKTPGGVSEDHDRQRAECPLRVEEGRLAAGYLPLTPPSPASHYRAALWAGPADEVRRGFMASSDGNRFLGWPQAD